MDELVAGVVEVADAGGRVEPHAQRPPADAAGRRCSICLRDIMTVGAACAARLLKCISGKGRISYFYIFHIEIIKETIIEW